MQIYIPLTVGELGGGNPPCNDCVMIGVSEGEDGFEEAKVEALDDAGIASLVLARESGDIPTRLVASAFVKDERALPARWADVDSLYVDDAQGRELAGIAVDAQTQEEADEIISQLLDEPLMWADISEREKIHDHLRGKGAW